MTDRYLKYTEQPIGMPATSGRVLHRETGTNSLKRCKQNGYSAFFGTAPQRPGVASSNPGPADYSPASLDELERKGKIVDISGHSKRNLFARSPNSPGPAYYATEGCSAAKTTGGGAEVVEADTEQPPPARHAHGEDVLTADRWRPAPVVQGTFGLAERFPRETSLTPGVGDYDVGSTDRAVRSTSRALSTSMGRRGCGAPYDPCLGRYLYRDSVQTPSAHDYRPKTGCGGGRTQGAAGHSPGLSLCSFGGKWRTICPPDGPGPGKFWPAGARSGTPTFRFGCGRSLIHAFTTGIPWDESVAWIERGEGGGADAKLFLPKRNRHGARAMMSSRRLPRPRPGTKQEYNGRT